MSSLNLIADVGGTNARFALVREGGLLAEQIEVLPCADFASPIDAIRTYLSNHGNPAVDHAVFALATPISGDVVKMTNNHWEFSISAISAAFSIPEVRLINDFTAQALAIPHLTESEYFAVGPNQTKEGAAIGVVGPGTGLGVSGLVSDGHGGWITFSGEGGHVTVAPRTEREYRLVRFIGDEIGHVSAERLLSGPGLTRIYQSLRVIDNQTPRSLAPSEILARATAGQDAYAAETLDIFCSQLGACAGNLALTIYAQGGIYIAGGIVPRMRTYFESSSFRQAFEDKGRMSRLLVDIPTRVVTATYPALTGLASALR